MNNVSKISLITIGIFFGIFGLLFPAVAIYFFLAMLNVLLYVILAGAIEGRITNVIGNLFMVSIILIMMELILSFVLLISTNFILLRISAFLTVFTLALFLILYIREFIGGMLHSIEIRLKK